MIGLGFTFDENSKVSLYMQIYSSIREKIIDGHLPAPTLGSHQFERCLTSCILAGRP